ncbi:hypothetical protein P280DRAFT_474087 [Massarina eburnea CBS 473.64]|uniref:Stc1 domain-containing protein n=1 Tax=Massarina eburnea CBS 473.64 TaxID=1395130 RepID=A0A6A6RHM7_9PLEO|nr:hypothetical protein P280DRAFT_474087 [Massarina eburnea CBS 473.64]
MARKQKPAHFYDQATINILKDVPLPPKIKCGRCSKWLGHAQYSVKQLCDARRAIKSSGHNAQYSINCQGCSGNGQVVELTCCFCRRTKGLEDFAKSQRKKPDSAKCFDCVNDQLDQDAINEDVYESDDRSKLFAPSETARGYGNISVFSEAASEKSVNGDWQEVKSADDEDADAGGIGLSRAFQHQMSMSPSNNVTLIETKSEYNLGSEDEWQSAQTRSWRTPSQNTPSTSSAFDVNKYGRPAPRSVSGSSHTWSSGVAERSEPDKTVYKNGWAKIKAYVRYPFS